MCLRGPGADPLGEEAQPDPHVLAAGPPVRLLTAQLRVAGQVHRDLQRAGVVAGVVLPPGRAGVRELFGPQQVRHPQLRRVLAELGGQQVDHPLDQVDPLGDAERAGVGDPAGGLVGVDPGDLAVRGLQVVGAGEDVEEPGRVLAGLRGPVERAVVGQHPGPQGQDPAVPGRGDLTVHVVVTGERGGHQVLRPVLDPLHRLAGHHGGDHGAEVSRVHRDLVAEPAADIRGDDPDLVLGQPGHQRVQGAVRVRCLRGRPHRQLPGDRVHLGHRTAGLQRRGVRARVEHVLGDHHVCGREGRVGGGPVPGRPVEDVVVPLAGHVVADQRGARVQGPGRVHDHWQRLVFHTDQLERVPGGVTVLGDDERHLLALEPDLVGGQHGLDVAGEGGHPGQLPLLEHLAGDDGPDPGVGQRGGGVHAHDAGVGQRAAQDRAVQHAGPPDVVHERALAAQEPGVLLAPHRAVGPAAGRIWGCAHQSSAGPPAPCWLVPGPPVPCCWFPARRSRAGWFPARRSRAGWPTGPSARCSRTRCTGTAGRTGPRGSPQRSVPDGDPAATGPSSSCLACRTRTAARGTPRSPAGPGPAGRRGPGPPRCAPGARRPWPPAPCTTSPASRPARPRRPRSWRCRTPSATRSARGHRAGNGSAAAGPPHPWCG